MKVKEIIQSFSLIAAITMPLTAIGVNAQSGPGGYGNVQTVYTCSRDGDSINLRARPGRGYRVLTEIPPGRSVVLMSDVKVVAGYTWRKVSFYGATGWVRGDFLCD